MVPRRIRPYSLVAGVVGPFLALWLPVCQGCMGGPYLYVTFHGGVSKGDINQVLR